MSRPRAKAVGERGSWFASVEGERLPCFHRYWVTGTRHESRGGGGSRKHRDLIAAISSDPRVILTQDCVIGDGEGFERTGYIAVFRICLVDADDDCIRFDLVERLIDLE